MAEDSDGQQITVAELLKRMGAEQQDAPSGRRRRRADEGGVSVSELTGEIPRITDDTVLSGRAARRRAREAEEAEAGGQSSSAGEGRAGAAQPGESTTTTPSTPTPSTPQSGQPAGPTSQAAAGQAPTRQGPPVAPAPQTPPVASARPSPRGASAPQSGPAAPGTQTPAGQGQQAAPGAQPAAATTAKMPAQQRPTPPQTPGGQAARAGTTSPQAPAETTAPQPPATQAGSDEASGPRDEKRGRRGLFGRKRKGTGPDTDAATAKDAGAPDSRTSAPQSEGPSKGSAAAAGSIAAGGAAGAAAGSASAPAEAPSAARAQPAVPAARTVQPGQPVKSDQPAPSDKDDVEKATGASAKSGASATGTAADKQAQAWGVPSGSGSTAHRAPEAPADVPAPTSADAADSRTGAGEDTDSDGRPGMLGATTAAAAGGAGVAGMTAAALSGGEHSEQPLAEELKTGQPETDQYRDFDPSAAHGGPERSGASQWLILIAQVLASAVAGAALFIGFQLLWGDLPWVAFALAVIVIVGLVAMVRVLRRSNDTVSIALAVMVGLGVTCGPLLLRLVT